MARQVQIILDDQVREDYRKLCKAEGKSIQKDVEAYIKRRLGHVSDNAGSNGVGKGEIREALKREPLIG